MDSVRMAGRAFSCTSSALLASCSVKEAKAVAAVRRYSSRSAEASAMKGCTSLRATISTRTWGSDARNLMPMAAYRWVMSVLDSVSLIRLVRAPCLYMDRCTSSHEARLARAREASCCTSSLREKASCTSPTTALSSTIVTWFSGSSDRFASRPAHCRCMSSSFEATVRRAGRRARSCRMGCFSAVSVDRWRRLARPRACSRGSGCRSSSTSASMPPSSAHLSLYSGLAHRSRKAEAAWCWVFRAGREQSLNNPLYAPPYTITGWDFTLGHSFLKERAAW
mmetsp:Transcript_13046/g.28963  ORF Transcript_13046/g.28963 Transcript_13046/m.28963 type:complete len:280 (-) Transcript_13046:5859-6698(-)